MKFSAAFVAAAVAGLAAAQSQCLSSAEAIPSCGQSCLTAAGSSYGCMYTDFACQCSHSSEINNAALTSCVLSACSDAQTALMVSSDAQALCSCVSANGGGSMMGSMGSSGATTSAMVPSTTAAMSGGAGPTSAAGGAGGSGSSASMFTGGAAYAAGSIGGVMAGLLGLVAAL